MIDKKTQKVICVFIAKGQEHDFSIFKQSKLAPKELTRVLADKGYQGLQDLHLNSQTPQRKPPKQALSPEAIHTNRKLAKTRIYAEHVIRRLKIWRILKETYRNSRKRFGIKLNLIAAIAL